MRAVIVKKPGELVVADIARLVPGPYQALVKTEVAALCNSTDAKVIAGHFPGIDKYPLVLGHENAGIVCEVGPKVRSFAVGDRVISAMVCFGLALMKSSPRSFVISASLSSIRLFICPVRSPSKSAPWAWVLVRDTCTTSSPRPFLEVGSTRREFSMLTWGSFHW